jgi:methanogenic corrinoid protein MtbC1
MTLVQQMRTEGFRANLETRGLLVRLSVSGPIVGALYDDGSSFGGQYVAANEIRVGGTLSILREDLVTAGLAGTTIGDVWLETTGGVSHRVTEKHDNPIDIAVKFTVETLKAS